MPVAGCRNQHEPSLQRWKAAPPRPHCGGDPAPADPVTSPLRSTQVETDAVCQGRGPETPSARLHVGPGPDGRGTGVCFEKGLN